ncbi:hypothetical protein MKX03_033325, partial [Papaver bracteatum]
QMDGCCSTQLIYGDGSFNFAVLARFSKDVKLAERGFSYAVVSIMGPQSSGINLLKGINLCYLWKLSTVEIRTRLVIRLLIPIYSWYLSWKSEPELFFICSISGKACFMFFVQSIFFK